MTPVLNFIHNIIEALLKDYPNLHLIYQYKISSETHFIKLPAEIYNDSAFLEKDLDWSQMFFESFGESLAFITEGALTELDQPEIVIISTKDFQNEAPFVSAEDLSNDTSIIESIIYGKEPSFYVPAPDTTLNINEDLNQHIDTNIEDSYLQAA
ncbi:MAG: hypothetical protein R3D00_24710 [Bacteroidia bacterium]